MTDEPGRGTKRRRMSERSKWVLVAFAMVVFFGFEAFRASPRQADLLILSGRVSIKMAPIIRRIYDQMLEPKWAIAMGACCSSQGVFNNYAIVPADKFMPIDVHVPGCPPRPEALMHGILQLREQIQFVLLNFPPDFARRTEDPNQPLRYDQPDERLELIAIHPQPIETIQGFNGVVGMQRGEHKMSGFSGGD